MPKINRLPNLEFLQARFSYDPSAGILTYRARVSQRRAAGSEAGFVHHLGYRYVKFYHDGVKTQAAVHRICWALFHGEVPPTDMEVDHIDRNKLNNRISNLRLATRSENARNTSKSFSRITGVSQLRSGGWRAYVYASGRQIHIGSYKSEAEAAQAVKSFGAAR